MMTNVLYVSQLNANLFSILALNQRKFSILFHFDGVNILQDSIPVAFSILQGWIYFLQSS